MSEIELLALYWTISGPAEVHVGREWSTFSWPDRCAEAARVGFSGLGRMGRSMARFLLRVGSPLGVLTCTSGRASLLRDSGGRLGRDPEAGGRGAAATEYTQLPEVTS